MTIIVTIDLTEKYYPSQNRDNWLSGYEKRIEAILYHEERGYSLTRENRQWIRGYGLIYDQNKIENQFISFLTFEQNTFGTQESTSEHDYDPDNFDISFM